MTKSQNERRVAGDPPIIPMEPPYSVDGRLRGKVAIVVGAGQTDGETIGNGRATAIAFARAGASVLLVDRDVESAKRTSELIAAGGGTAKVLEADITHEDQAASIARQCAAEFGRIDILHNNVGIGTGDGGITTLSRSTWDHILEVNLTGVYLTCKYVLPHMRERRAGVILNVSSGAAVVSLGLAAYKVSKAGLNALTHNLATANARYGIRANVIAPGLLDTPMAMQGYSDALDIDTRTLRQRRNAVVPLGHMGTAWDTAYAAVYLASDEARFVTGVVLPVDGGQTAQIG